MTKRLVLIALAFLSGALTGAAEPVRPGRDEVRLQLRQGARFAAPGAAVQDAFAVDYTLARPAWISVTLLDPNHMPLRTFHVALGAEGTAAGPHRLTVWDGKDSEGLEAPAGEYAGALSFRYADGTVENKRFRLVKP